jgi:hypothetical protein
MSVAFVVRLMSEALSNREITGRIEAVQTGEQAAVRTADELIAFMYDQAQRQKPARARGPIADASSTLGED